jgi:3alpha(or 20beta)-hydroxysteroid dehydrogenase
VVSSPISGRSRYSHNSNTMTTLNGKTALISGAAMGMGASHARLFIEHGARVILADVAVDQGQALAAELGKNALFLELDVSDHMAWERVVLKGEQSFGPIRILINNAGIAGPRIPTADFPVDLFQKIMTINAFGIFHGMRAVIPGMIRAGSGTIVNISSTAGFKFNEGTPNLAYSGSKFAVRGMTKAAAVEYASHNIRVNSVHPGAVLTPMVANGLTDEGRETVSKGIPLGRFADPSELSQVVLFMASDASSYMTGSEVLVDGGLLR